MRAARRTTPRTADDGYSLIEVTVAMTVFVMICVAVLGLLLTATAAARANTRTAVATGLAARQIESARGQRALDIPDGAVTRTETVSGVRYTITQTADYVAADSAVSLCSGGAGRLAYKLVTVVVTWAGMGRTPAVRSDTLRALGSGADGLDGAGGVVAVAVRSALDAPVPGVEVALAPAGTSRTTGTDGCAVFVGLTAGSYRVTPSAALHVDSVNDPRPAPTTVAVTSGGITRTTLLYDRAVSLAATVSGPSGHAVPASGLPITLRSSYLTARVLPACPTTGTAAGCVTGDPPRLVGIFPAVYSLWPGTCLDAAPAATGVDLTGPNPPADVAVVAAAATVDVRVAGTSTAGRTVTATHAADPAGAGGCPSGETYTLPGTVAGGVGVLLPSGRWTFTTPGAGSVTATLSPSGPTAVTLLAAS